MEAAGLGGNILLLPPVGTPPCPLFDKIPCQFLFPKFVPLYLKAITWAIFAEKTGRE